MNRHTISISQLTQQILFEKKMNLLLESVRDKALTANKELMTLGKELKTSNIDPTDEEIQAALLVKAIENGGNVKNIEP